MDAGFHRHDDKSLVFLFDEFKSQDTQSKDDKLSLSRHAATSFLQRATSNQELEPF